MDDNITLWGIHAGSSGEAESLFLNKKVIALGWAALGDLKLAGNTRDSFKAHYATRYPEAKPASIPASAGQLFRFVHEIKVGDLVAFPAKRTRTIHLGKITGEYKYVLIPF